MNLPFESQRADIGNYEKNNKKNIKVRVNPKFEGFLRIIDMCLQFLFGK